MAIIKVVNIKKTPIKNLKYIANNEKIEKGKAVKIDRIEGVKLVVIPITDEDDINK